MDAAIRKRHAEVWDDFFCTIVGWTMHPGYYRDNADKPSLQDCAETADRMLEIRRERMNDT